MRILVTHETQHEIVPPARTALQILRLTPTSHEGQHVRAWRVECDEACRLRATEDAFGNQIHVLSADAPIAQYTVAVTGEVETFDTAGVVRGTRELFPPGLYLRETAYTEVDAPFSDFVRAFGSAAPGETMLEKLHRLMNHLHESYPLDPGTAIQASAGEAFARSRGTLEDHVHVFIAAARHLDIPARYIAGYRAFDEESCARGPSHAWAEAFVPELGWVGFDTVYGSCPTERYIRVAVALDHAGAAPIVGAGTGDHETSNIAVTATDAVLQSQS